MADHRSRFEHWDAAAWVRSKPRRTDAFVPGVHYFSPDLCPALRHPAVPSYSRERLLIHHLYLYLEFTVRLETGPVNEVCLLLRSPDFLPWLDSRMKDDALRIYTDEAGHAEMSHTLLASVRDRTGVRPVPHEPHFLRELAALCSGTGLDPSLVKLFFVIVSETLITASLNRLPGDSRVQEQVRGLAIDHAADEGRHYAYFRELFEHLWPRLDPLVRQRIGVLLPRMMSAFLGTDEPALTAVLADCDVADPASVAAEVACARETLDSIREGARPTLRMFRRVGMFDDAVIADAFEELQ
ncbi:diiron oxygenase [Streptomyces sp. NPDC059627]